MYPLRQAHRGAARFSNRNTNKQRNTRESLRVSTAPKRPGKTFPGSGLCGDVLTSTSQRFINNDLESDFAARPDLVPDDPGCACWIVLGIAPRQSTRMRADRGVSVDGERNTCPLAFSGNMKLIKYTLPAKLGNSDWAGCFKCSNFGNMDRKSLGRILLLASTHFEALLKDSQSAKQPEEAINSLLAQVVSSILRGFAQGWPCCSQRVKLSAAHHIRANTEHIVRRL